MKELTIVTCACGCGIQFEQHNKRQIFYTKKCRWNKYNQEAAELKVEVFINCKTCNKVFKKVGNKINCQDCREKYNTKCVKCGTKIYNDKSNTCISCKDESAPIRNCSNCLFGKFSKNAEFGFECKQEIAGKCKPYLLDNPRFWRHWDVEE